MELKKRERKVDLSKMTIEEVDVLSAQIGAKIRTICDEAVAKANQILHIYGANAKMIIEIADLPDSVEIPGTITNIGEKPYKNDNLKDEQLP